jgi:hypothetical protein
MARHNLKISSDSVKSFLASLFVSMNVASPFLWNREIVRNTIGQLMHENTGIRMFHGALTAPGSESFYAWFEGSCLDHVDKRRNLVRLNDTCVRFANQRRGMFSPEIAALLRQIGPDFYQRTQLPA